MLYLMKSSHMVDVFSLKMPLLKTPSANPRVYGESTMDGNPSDFKLNRDVDEILDELFRDD